MKNRTEYPDGGATLEQYKIVIASILTDRYDNISAGEVEDIVVREKEHIQFCFDKDLSALRACRHIKR